VLDAEPIDDLGAGGDDIADRAAADAPFELANHVGREPVGERRERAIENDPHHFPMPGDRVLPG
jgi:hypothetical protein